MSGRSDLARRCEAAFVTPTGEKAVSQLAVRVERTIPVKATVPFALVTLHATFSLRRPD